MDDDTAFRDLTETFLDRADERLAVVSVSSSHEGLDVLDRYDIDCVVSDYDMPGMDGLALLEVVRERYPDLPFILFTGKGSEEIASEAISTGVSDYIQKRGHAEQYELLANRIRNLVEHYHAQVQARRVFEAIDVVGEGVSLLNQDGIFRYVNRAYAELFGYERDALIGEHCSLLYSSPKQYERIQESAARQLIERGRWSGRTETVRNDGTEILIDHTLSITSDGTIVCLMTDQRDER